MVRSVILDLSAFLVRSSTRGSLGPIGSLAQSGSLLIVGSLIDCGSLVYVGSLRKSGSLVYVGSLRESGSLKWHGSLVYIGSLPIRLDLVDMLLVCKLKHIRHWCRLAKLNLMPNLVQMR